VKTEVLLYFLGMEIPTPTTVPAFRFDGSTAYAINDFRLTTFRGYLADKAVLNIGLLEREISRTQAALLLKNCR
jgi:hypothetical protein